MERIGKAEFPPLQVFRHISLITPVPTMSSSSRPPFRLGLALAGAATGGAYAAGVMDFLWEAMIEWEAAKERNDPDVPKWSVCITDMAGSSAGGVTAALAAATANTKFSPNVTGDREQNAPLPLNPMYNTWVTLMNSTRIFDKTDLNQIPNDSGPRRIGSLFSSTFMGDIARDVLPEPSDESSRVNWIDPTLTVTLLTVNLRGIPYSVGGFITKDPTFSRFSMQNHEDYVRFHFTMPDEEEEGGAVLPDSYNVGLSEKRTSENWAKVITAARATAAFPGGFPTVRVEPKRKDYESRRMVAPDWPPEGSPESLEPYAAVDGGMLNNEPFMLLERQMRDRHGQSLKSDAEHAWGCVILIDPFPERNTRDNSLAEENMPLLNQIPALISSLRADAMFNESDILDALDERRLDRFMIIPDRDVKGYQKSMLATSGLGAFAGVIDEKIRKHDFLLGRCNCQKFLQEVLRMPVEAAKENEIFNGDENEKFLTGETIGLIPLVGSAAKDLERPDWPSYTEKEINEMTERVGKDIDRRMEIIVDIQFKNTGVIKEGFTLNPVTIFGNVVSRIIKGRLMDFLKDQARERVKQALDPFAPESTQTTS